MTDLRTRIAAVQSEHQAPGNACLCGWEYDPIIDDSHFDHVADAVIRELGLWQQLSNWHPGYCRYVTDWKKGDDE